MHTKKFIKLSKVKKLQDSDLKKVKGGVNSLIKVTLLYGIEPLYGINP